MKLWVGTSGYSYKAWLGNFYPERLAAKEMLRFYASRLPAVEINNTFYRLPKESVLQSWAEQVPAEFSFVLKAPQRITHQKRLKRRRKRSRVSISRGNCIGLAYRRRSFSAPALSPQEFADTAKFLGDFAGGPSGGF
jgi:uncharacterized protein YecE (DUF72 family)